MEQMSYVDSSQDVLALKKVIIMGRSRRLNQRAQVRLLAQSEKTLKQIQWEMVENNGSEEYFLDKENIALQYYTKQIDDLLRAKFALCLNTMQRLVTDVVLDNPDIFTQIKNKTNKDLVFYDKEIKIFQDRMSAAWDKSFALLQDLLAHEKQQNEKLMGFYRFHIACAQQCYLTTMNQVDSITENIGDDGFSLTNITRSFCTFLQYCMKFCQPAHHNTHMEIDLRRDVFAMEKAINGDENYTASTRPETFLFASLANIKA